MLRIPRGTVLSRVAFSLLLSASAAAKVDKTTLPLTPVETVWGLALNNTLTMAPAYQGRLAFIPIEGDRLVAYDLVTGRQQWLVTAHPELPPVAGDGFVFLREAGKLRALHTE